MITAGIASTPTGCAIAIGDASRHAFGLRHHATAPVSVAAMVQAVAALRPEVEVVAVHNAADTAHPGYGVALQRVRLDRLSSEARASIERQHAGLRDLNRTAVMLAIVGGLLRLTTLDRRLDSEAPPCP